MTQQRVRGDDDLTIDGVRAHNKLGIVGNTGIAQRLSIAFETLPARLRMPRVGPHEADAAVPAGDQPGDGGARGPEVVHDDRVETFAVAVDAHHRHAGPQAPQHV